MVTGTLGNRSSEAISALATTLSPLMSKSRVVVLYTPKGESIFNDCTPVFLDSGAFLMAAAAKASSAACCAA